LFRHGKRSDAAAWVGMMSVQIWIPLLFLVIGVFHAVMAWREYQRKGTTDSPVFKAKSRVAGIFIVVSLMLFVFLTL
jgi:membrane protein implicated in regulation of membrane protease activity